jgi:hypothetical protein
MQLSLSILTYIRRPGIPHAALCHVLFFGMDYNIIS